VSVDDLDVSGLVIDPTDPNILWIASHKAKTTWQWDIADATVLGVYPIATPKAEGIAFGPDDQPFVVDDRTGELHRLVGVPD
jgi:hypothetical protein